MFLFFTLSLRYLISNLIFGFWEINESDFRVIRPFLIQGLPNNYGRVRAELTRVIYYSILIN